jgi:hypothetical protein
MELYEQLNKPYVFLAEPLLFENTALKGEKSHWDRKKWNFLASVKTPIVKLTCSDCKQTVERTGWRKGS